MPGPDLAPDDLAAGPADGASSEPPPLTPEERRTRLLARRVTLVAALVAGAAALALLFVRRGPSLPPYAVVFAEGAAQHRVGPGIAPLHLAHGADVDLVLRPTEAPHEVPHVVVCADAAGVLKPVDAQVDAAASGALHVRVHADTVLALPGTERLWIVVAPAAADVATACESPPPRAQMLLVKLGGS
jgi:hypothetical protein